VDDPSMLLSKTVLIDRTPPPTEVHVFTCSLRAILVRFFSLIFLMSFA